MSLFFDQKKQHAEMVDLHLRKGRTVSAEEAEDLQYSAALAHEDVEIPRSYFRSVGILGSIAASSLAVVCALWGFAPAASVLSFIGKDLSE